MLWRFGGEVGDLRWYPTQCGADVGGSNGRCYSLGDLGGLILETEEVEAPERVRLV